MKLVRRCGGAWAATVGGAVAAPLLAASLAFMYLGYQEVCNHHNNNTPLLLMLSFRLAVPMTLNNLAGGVAGGVAGIQPGVAFLYALVASLVAMASGHVFGWKIAKTTAESRQQPLRAKPELVAATVYFSLSLLTLYEAIR